MVDDGSEVLPVDLMSRLIRLQLATRRPLVGGLLGEHRSPRFGSSLDFSDYRQYHPGDDLRRVDMNAFARLDRLLLKLFEAEDDVEVRLLVDTSGSMEGPKLERAVGFAAAIGLVALTNRDAVSLHTFPQALRPGSAAGRSEGARSGGLPVARFVGPSGQVALFDRLAQLEAGGETPFASAALDVLSRPGPAGLTVVISDLLTPEWGQGLRRLPARRGDLVVVHVLDPTDLVPDVSGDVQLVDAETGATVDVSISPSVADDYVTLVDRWLGEVAGRVHRAGGAYVRSLTDEDLSESVLKSLTAGRVLQ